MCPVYVARLIRAGDRKSAQPMAARGGEVGYDQLHHFYRQRRLGCRATRRSLARRHEA
jgi:hypothetical protein